MEKTCKDCSRMFNTHKKQKLYCSDECRLNKARIRSGRNVLKGLNINSGTVGALSEMVVICDLIRRGYDTFRAVSPSCYCDVIATKDGKILRVEARTGYMSETGSMCFPKKKSGKNQDIDMFAVVERNSNTVFYFKDDGITEMLL